MWVGLGVGVSGSLLAASYVYWITEHKLIPTLLIAGGGLAGLLITYLFSERMAAAATTPSAHQDVRQEASPQINVNPQINVSVGNSAAAAPAYAPEPKPEPRHNIEFIDVRSGPPREQVKVFSRYAGQTLTYSAAVFENKYAGQEALAPYVKARAIYRRPDSNLILDISNLPWIPGKAEAHWTKFEVNTPKYLLLFFLANNARYCRSVESSVHRVAGSRRMISVPRDYQIPDPIGSIEVQLLTETQLMYAVLLDFVDSDSTLLPLCTGHREL